MNYRAPTNFYVHAYVAIAVSDGAPSYAVTLGVSAFGAGALVYGQGNQAQLGPVLLSPGEVVSIIVTGAAPMAAVAGQIMGWQAMNPSDLLPLLPIQPTAVSVSNVVTGVLDTALASDGITPKPLNLDAAGNLKVSQTTSTRTQPFDITLAPATFTDLISAVGATIVLRSWSITVVGTEGGKNVILQDISPINYAVEPLDQFHSQIHDLGATAAAPGADIGLIQNGTVGHRVTGTITYSVK